MAEYRVQVILPHDQEECILMQAQGDAWTLPTISLEVERSDSWGIFSAAMGLKAAAGCEVTMLYCPYFAHQPLIHAVFVAENRSADFQPGEGLHWMSEAALEKLPLAHEQLRPVIARYFAEQRSGVFPAERPPWAYPGWLDRARAWIHEQLVLQGLELRGEIVQVRKWCITCMLRVPTTGGDLYFKAVPPTFAREIAVTRHVMQRCPQLVPQLVASNESERWLLLRDFGGQALSTLEDAAVWQQVVTDFAMLQQQALLLDLPAMQSLGALDYRAETLPQKLVDLLDDSGLLRPDEHLPAEEIERLRSAVPRVRLLCQALADFELPLVLMHGDFHPWNVAAREGGSVFYDWTDASLGHLFFDIALFLSAAERELLRDDPGLVASMRERYLGAFAGLAPDADLRAAFALAEVLAMLQQAVNYHHLVASIEAAERWTLNDINIFLKRFLTRLEHSSMPGS
jgi:hypothetical protein